MKSICKIFSQIGVNLRAESNKSNQSMIRYINATVTMLYSSSNYMVKDLIWYRNCYNTIVTEVIL